MRLKAFLCLHFPQLWKSIWHIDSQHMSTDLNWVVRWVHFCWENRKDVSICWSQSIESVWQIFAESQNGFRILATKRETLEVQMEGWNKIKLKISSVKTQDSGRIFLLKLRGKKLPQAWWGEENLKRALASCGGSEGKAACPQEPMLGWRWGRKWTNSHKTHPLGKRGILMSGKLSVKKERAELRETLRCSEMHPRYTPWAHNCPLLYSLFPCVFAGLE